jgi:hypothetical protein
MWDISLLSTVPWLPVPAGRNFAQRLNSFTEPALHDSGAMWLSKGKPRKPSSFLKPPVMKSLQ